MKMETQQGKAMQAWELDLGGKAKGTRDEYSRYFKRFLERWGVSPDDLFEMRMKDLKQDDPRDRKRIEKMVKLQQQEMRESGFSKSTCYQLSKSVCSFFVSQELPLNLRNSINGKSGMGVRLAPRETILDIYDNMVFTMRKRNQAIVCFLKDSGIRVSDLSNLNWMNYEDAQTSENEFGERFKIFNPQITQKCGVPAYIHIGPEAVKAVENYIEERKANGEILDSDSPLILDDQGKRMSARALSSLFVRAKRKLGKRGEKIGAHSLRKFHETMLESAGLNPDWIKKLKGKSVSTYSRPEETGELTKSYLLAYDKLRIFGESEKIINKKTANLEKRIRELEQALEQSKKQLIQRDEKFRSHNKDLDDGLKELLEWKKQVSNALNLP